MNRKTGSRQQAGRKGRGKGKGIEKENISTSTFTCLCAFVPLCLLLLFSSRAFSLTLEEAVDAGLKNNKNLKALYESVAAESAKVNAAKHGFDWEWFVSYAASRSESPTASLLTGAQNTSIENSMSNSLGVKKLYVNGDSFKLQYDVENQKTNSTVSLLNPNTSSNMLFQYTMPLMKNKGAVVLVPIKLQQNAYKQEKLQMLQSVVEFVYQIQNAFLDVVYTKENLALQQDELKLAETVLKETQARIKAGLLAPSEVFSAQARLATAQKNVISAESAYQSARDLLYTFLSSVDAETEVDPVTFSFSEPDAVFPEEEQIGTAMKNRTEIFVTENQIQRANLIQFQAQNDAKLPLDVAFNLGLFGKDRSFGKSFSQTAGADFPSWQINVTLSQPFGNKKARWDVEASKNQVTGSELKLQQLKLDVSREVRDAMRQFETAKKSFEQAEAAQEYQKQVAETELQKLKAGLSTSFLVQQASKDYLAAKVAVLQAKIAIYKALFLIQKVTASDIPKYEKIFN